MNTKKLIRKFLFATFWLAIGGGMLTLLIAAMGRQKKDHCKGFQITLKGAGDNFFITESQVEKLLKDAAKGKIKGQPKTAFHLQSMEKLLEQNVWIRDAEIYFDNKDVMHVSVTERIPVARIFNVVGKSYYIDETCRVMPLSTEQSARVPVFTGFPSKIISKRDSALLIEVREIANYILENGFWMAQVAQVDITKDREFELYPVVGSHVVKLGNAENLERKFHRLFVFYRNVLSKTGFEKYEAIDVQFSGQVIGVKANNRQAVDSAKLRYNVEKLLQQARQIPTEDQLAARALRDQQRINVDPVMSATAANPVANSPAEGNEAPRENENSETNQPRIPKAVMGRQNENNNN